MNTRLGKSFGLAFMVAVGILALMFALGTFSAQQAGAAAIRRQRIAGGRRYYSWGRECQSYRQVR